MSDTATGDTGAAGDSGAPADSAVHDVTHAHLTSVSPTPPDEEVVAIMAGVEALWPKPAVLPDEAPPRNTAWRFSGRWWSRPISARRARPYR